MHRNAKIAIGLMLALALGAGTAAGKDLYGNDWKRAVLDNNPNLTIEVPSVVGNNYLPSQSDRASGTLMALDTWTKAEGDFSCYVFRFEYDAGMTRDKTVHLFAKEPKKAKDAGRAFCMSGSNTEMLESKTLTSNGLPGTYCAASDLVKDSNRFEVNSALVVLARRHIFEVQCSIDNANSREDAEDRWDEQGEDDAWHVQQSLQLPADER
jgi:hypothetical protein